MKAQSDNRLSVCIGLLVLVGCDAVDPTLSLGGTWNNASDVSLKENFIETDRREILEELATLPIRMWNYKAEDAETRHLGPTAQDFAAAFGLGGSTTTIGTVDTDGVALAAIQGLHEIVQEKEAAIALQQEHIAELHQEMTYLQDRLAALELLVVDLINGR